MSNHSDALIRVLHVVTNMSYGGLENLLMNYYRNIDRCRIQFDFLTHVDIHQDFEEEIAALGGRLYRLSRLNPFSISYRKALRTFFREHPEYRIVHSHLNCMSAIPLKAAKQSGVPVRIAHSHNSNMDKNWKMLLKLLYRSLIPHYATALFSCGKQAGDWMFGGRPYTILSNAIDADSFRFRADRSRVVREKLGLDDSFVIGHVGQFREQKNHPFLLDIFAEILKLNPDSAMMLVGKGSQMESAMKKAERLGIREKILFLGARPDIPELLQAMDVFVMPSFYEGLPVSLVEAQAAGLPCVISDTIPGDCRLTTDLIQLSLNSPPEVWAETILRYQNAPRPDNLRIISEAGFDICTNAGWLEEFYCST